MELYDYQKPAAEAIEAALRTHRAAVDASDTGVGKTHTACHVAARLGHPVLVVCPKIVIGPWQKTMAGYGVRAHVVNYEKLRTGKTPWLRKEGRGFKWTIDPDTLIVWDEFHRAKAPTTATAKMAYAAKSHINLMLSATLAESPLEMRAVGYLTGMHDWDNWWPWCRRNGCKSNPWGGMYLAQKRREEVLKELHNYLFPERGARIRIADLGDLFPETQITADAYSFDEDIQSVYDALDKSLEVLAGCEDYQANVLTAQLRARQEVELRKVPGLIRMTQDAIAEGMSVVVFTNFTETLTHLTTALECSGIRGGQTEAEREIIIEQFQSDEARCIVVNIQAGGVGLSLHDLTGKHPRLALVCPTYGAKALKQALGRVHRAGGKSRSIQRIIFAADTIEETICQTVQQKLQNLDLLNDGDFFLQTPLNESNEPLSEPAVNDISTTAAEAEHPLKNIRPGTEPKERPVVTNTPKSESQERAHAKHSPSSLKYKLMCPGWRNNNDPDRDMSYADRGTRGHEAWELGTSDGIKDDPSLRDAVDMCIKYSARFDGEVFLEQKVAVLDQFGFFDRLVVKGNKGWLLDAKFAHNLYRADSPQFWGYLIGIWDDPRWAHLEDIEVHALHPWLNTVDFTAFNRAKDYQRLMLATLAAVERAKAEDPATFQPFEGCRFCGRAGVCPKLGQIGVELAAKYSGEPLAFPEGSLHGSEITDPVAIATLLDAAPALEAAISGWRKASTRMWQEDGVVIPGYQLVERAGMRKITSAAPFFQLYLERGGDPQEFATVASIGVGDAEDLWASVAPRGKKGASKQELNDLLLDRDAITLGENSFYLKKQKTNTQKTN